MHRLGTLYSPPTGRAHLTTLAQASLALQTARSHPSCFAPGLSTTHEDIATRDPDVSPDRTHTGRPSRTYLSLHHRGSAWLKPFGESGRPIRKDWTNEFLQDPAKPLALMTGPEKRETPPTMRPGDFVVLHAVGHGYVIAAGELLSPPKWSPDAATRWNPRRWPWIYQYQINVWVPRVHQGPHTWDFAQRLKGTIQFGRPYAELLSDEYERLLATLEAAPRVMRRTAA